MLKKVRRAIIGLVIINTLILMALSAYGGYYYASTQTSSEFFYEEPDEIFTSVGLVSEKGENYIKLDLDIKVLIDVNTQILDSNTNEFISLDLIPLESFVIANSDVDIKGKIEFMASSIQVIG